MDYIRITLLPSHIETCFDREKLKAPVTGLYYRSHDLFVLPVVAVIDFLQFGHHLGESRVTEIIPLQKGVYFFSDENSFFVFSHKDHLLTKEAVPTAKTKKKKEPLLGLM